MNYVLCREQTLVLQKELSELRRENDILKQVINDYQSGITRTNEQFQNRLVLEDEHSIKPISECSKEEKTGLPFWKLTHSECAVLAILLDNKGHATSRNYLASKLWRKPPSASFNTRLSMIVKSLRIKLKIENSEQEIIRTNYGKGYQLTAEFFDFYEIDPQFLKEYEEAY